LQKESFKCFAFPCQLKIQHTLNLKVENVPEKGSEFIKVPERPGSSSTSCVSQKICYFTERVKIAKEGKDLKCCLTVKINGMQN
jgi:hypothetical protein